MKDPKVIYLGPACQKEGDGREWCEDDAWTQCECGCSSVRYMLESDAQSELAAVRRRESLLKEKLADCEKSEAALRGELSLKLEAYQGAHMMVTDLKAELSALREELAEAKRQLNLRDEGPNCWTCGDQGYVHSIDGELRGNCDNCTVYELTCTKHSLTAAEQRLADAEQRNAELVDLLSEVVPYEAYLGSKLFNRISAAIKPIDLEQAVCTSCDGSGEYIDAIGDWRGYCSCPAGVALKNKPTESGASE